MFHRIRRVHYVKIKRHIHYVSRNKTSASCKKTKRTSHKIRRVHDVGRKGGKRSDKIRLVTTHAKITGNIIYGEDNTSTILKDKSR